MYIHYGNKIKLYADKKNLSQISYFQKNNNNRRLYLVSKQQ